MHEKGQVTSLAFGGQGIVRNQGMVTFVPFTAPGDEITFEVKKKKKNFACAELLHLLHASPARETPPCPHFGTCGGCQLQHIKYEEQLKYKRQWIVDALERIGGFEKVFVELVQPTEKKYQYRRRITLTMIPEGNCYVMGYHASDQSHLISVDRCSIFDESNVLLQLRETMRSLHPSDKSEGKVAVIKNGQRHLLIFHLKTMPKNAKQVIKHAFGSFANWQGVAIHTSKKSLEFGNLSPLLFNIDTFEFTFSPLAFVQGHPEQSAKIYQHICKIAQQVNAKKILDLYCGIGISTLMLSQNHEVTGIEWNKEAIRIANANRDKNQLIHASFMQGDVNTHAPEFIDQQKPDLVLVNPPRTGLELPTIQALIQSPSTQHIVYISCMPATLARDLKHFKQAGFRLVLCQPYDMFPQTTHVEVLAHLERK